MALPVEEGVLDVAAGNSSAFLDDAHVAGVHVRVLATPYFDDVAVQVSRPLTEVDHSLSRIRLFLILIAGFGVAVAAALGYVVSRAALAPVRRLTLATEHVTETGDLSERIDTTGQDELGRLASSFNSMLAALEDSTRAQRQLVADASHELRTPLTSLRTNIEVLASERTLPPGERERLLKDVVDQLGEMTTLIAELIELARGDRASGRARGRPARPRHDRRRRARRGATGPASRSNSSEGVDGARRPRDARASDRQPARQRRQVERARRHRRGARRATARSTVRDHGPGIDEEDLPYVFDRFYRAAAARGLPGSGLGLAIVKQVAEAHGGTVVAERAEGGGTLMRLRLNGRPEDFGTS